MDHTLQVRAFAHRLWGVRVLMGMVKWVAVSAAAAVGVLAAVYTLLAVDASEGLRNYYG